MWNEPSRPSHSPGIRWMHRLQAAASILALMLGGALVLYLGLHT